MVVLSLTGFACASAQCGTLPMLPLIRMLRELGEWMRLNGEVIYGSHAWVKAGEGEIANGKLKVLPESKLGKDQAGVKFGPQDFRFTAGKDGALCACCMTVPAPGAELKIKSLGISAHLLKKPLKSVTLIGNRGPALAWKQNTDGLTITCLPVMPFATAVGFKIE